MLTSPLLSSPLLSVPFPSVVFSSTSAAVVQSSVTWLIIITVSVFSPAISPTPSSPPSLTSVLCSPPAVSSSSRVQSCGAWLREVFVRRFITVWTHIYCLYSGNSDSSKLLHPQPGHYWWSEWSHCEFHCHWIWMESQTEVFWHNRSGV